jgi:hypothetical protein
MLKASLLAAAAFAIVAVAAPMGAHAQQDGSRQIVVDPAGAKGPGTGGGGGLGTGGGGGAGTGGGKKTPTIVAPVVVGPENEAGPEIATGSETETKKLVVDPAPVVGKAEPATVEPDPLDAIIGPAPTETVTEEAPVIEKVPAAIATTTATVGSPDELIVFLKSMGYQVEIDRKEKDGDYVLVVSSEKDKVSGYLLVVDHAHGKVVAKQKIDLADYGYARPEKYAKPQKYEHAKEPYEGGHDEYEADGGYEEGNSYDKSYDGGYEDNSYGGGSGSGY